MNKMTSHLTKRQEELNNCLRSIYTILNEYKLTLNEIFYVLGELIISCGTTLGANSPTQDDYVNTIANVPAKSLQDWLVKTGLLILDKIKREK